MNRILGNLGRVVLIGGLLYRASGLEELSASVWDGIYANAQAARGEAGYHRACASCHGEKLEGVGQASPLAGPEFMSNWNGMTVGELFEQIQTTMPADRPGQLSKSQTADILAYILKFNRFPAGSKELPADTQVLKRVRFEAEKRRK